MKISVTERRAQNPKVTVAEKSSANPWPLDIFENGLPNRKRGPTAHTTSSVKPHPPNAPINVAPPHYIAEPSLKRTVKNR